MSSARAEVMQMWVALLSESRPLEKARVDTRTPGKGAFRDVPYRTTELARKLWFLTSTRVRLSRTVKQVVAYLQDSSSG